MLQSEFLNAVREVGSLVVLYYYSLLVFGNWCLFVLQYSSPLHLSWTKLDLQVYEHVYETVDVEGSPDIRLVNSPPIVFFSTADSYHLSIISRLHVLTLDSESLTKKSPSCPFSAMSTSHSCLVMGPKYQDLPRTSSLLLLKSADTPLLAPAQLSITLHPTVDCYPLFAAREVPLEFGASGVPFFAPTSWVRN